MLPMWLQAGVWGFLAGGALLLGAAIAYFIPVSQHLIALVMAFGSGVLISALAFELMDKAYRQGGFDATAIGFLAGAALGAGPAKRVILVIDQAGWHVSDDVVLPDGLRVVFLPPYSPELQPAEHLWSLSDEALVNSHIGDLEALMEAQAERCRRQREQPEIIHASTHFHWWPEITTP